jgi:GNAT superfamily N-acetyltransferase
MSEIILNRTNSENPDFQSLVKLLDSELAVYNGEDNNFYMQYNTIENLNNVIVVYLDGEPAGCGAIKKFSPGTAEVKRMYVNSYIRGRGIGKKILDELEKWAQELDYKYLVLETGNFLKAAIALYSNSGFKIIPNYEPYTNMEKSVCFRKYLSNA